MTTVYPTLIFTWTQPLGDTTTGITTACAITTHLESIQNAMIIPLLKRWREEERERVMK
jgi:hypothetical protein